MINSDFKILRCLIHDLAECIVGDLTPSDNVKKEEKQQLENVYFLILN